MRSKQGLICLASLLSACILFTWLAPSASRLPKLTHALRWRPQEPTSQEPAKSTIAPKHLVVASVHGEDVSWIHRRLPDWSASVYVADDPTADLTVPENKGHEAMVYLTYIIDHYAVLPEFLLFVHGAQYQWHNDDPNKDSATVISRLQLPYLRRQGYVNLRCVWTLGCPAEIHPRVRAPEHPAEVHYADAFRQLFPNRTDDVPETVAVSCCAQFAVTADTVRRQPKETYEAWRRWLLATALDDPTSGRILEYSWHMLFGRAPVFCPDADTCYCDVFGLCGLKECTQQQCPGRYALPKSSEQPADWKPLPEFESAAGKP